MTEREWLIVGAFLVVVVVAYILGGLRRAPEPAAAKAVSPETAKPPPRPAASSPAPAAVAPRVTGASSPPSAKTTSGKPAAAALPMVKMEYEEDDEIDPTKVGSGPAPKRIVYQPPVKRIVYDDEAQVDEPTHSQSLFLVSATAQTDTGLRRKRNEDSLLVMESEGLFVVADGMGGYAGGERASKLAVKEIEGAFRNRAFEGEAHEGIPKPASELALAIQMANSSILETAKQNKELEGMGTTVCAARFSANKRRVYLAHVGDSRCYRLRKGELKQMTADHTMADHGVKGPAAAHLSRAVGVWPTVPIDVVMGVPRTDDAFLLCSDGLTKMLKDDEIASVLRGEPDPKKAVQGLIDAANGRGGKDNITVVLVRVVSTDTAREARS